jgi:glycosyltransferase involved in cell wall biosynthesis
MPAASTTPAAVSLVMPCYNEEACLRATAGELLDVFERADVPLELVLVDNGSRDSTGAIIDQLIAEGHPVVKVTVNVNQGYGNGVLEGLKACSAPMVGYLCADGQVAAEEAVLTYQQARAASGPVLAKVRRRFRRDSWRRKMVSVFYNVGMQFLFGWLHSIDLNASPKVFPRAALASLHLESKDWFLDPELMLKAKPLGLKILERDVEGLPRAGGKSNVRYSTCLQFAKNILRYRFGSAHRTWKRSVRKLERTEASSTEASSTAASSIAASSIDQSSATPPPAAVAAPDGRHPR